MESLMDNVDKIKDIAISRDDRPESIRFISGFLDNETTVPITHAKVKDIAEAAILFIKHDKEKLRNDAQVYYYSIFEALSELVHSE